MRFRFITYFVSALLFISSASCRKNRTIENLNGRFEVFGHGGMGIQSTYPLNSTESLQKCLQTDATGTELDVQLSKDSVLIAYHNEDLSENTTGSGRVNDLSWEELSHIRYKTTPYLEYQLTALEPFMASINASGKYITFDCKLYTQHNLESYLTIYSNTLVKLIQKFGLQNRCYIESQNETFLMLIKAKLPEAKLCIYRSVFAESLEVAKRLQLFGITMSSDLISKAQIQEAHQHGFFVAIWNVQSRKENREAMEKNPDSIQTDKLDYLLKQVKN